jgi:hypothetical protein
MVSVILSKEVPMYMCPIPNGFQDRDISMYSSKIVEKKEILRTVSNTGIYCSSWYSFIIIIGTTALCGPWPSSELPAILPSGYSFFGFLNSLFFMV